MGNKYIEVQLNYVLQSGDEQGDFCVDGTSEHKAAQLAREIAKTQRPYVVYAGYAIRKRKTLTGGAKPDRIDQVNRGG